MLKIRLQRVGKKHQPSYRIVLINSRRAPHSGAFLEILGSYNPLKNQVKLEGEKIKEWISKGAQVSDTVHNLLIKHGVIKGKKKNVVSLKKAEEKPEAQTEESQESETKTEEGDSGEKKEGVDEQ